MAASKPRKKHVQPQSAIPQASKVAPVPAEVSRSQAVARAMFEAFLAVGEADAPTHAGAKALFAQACTRLGLASADLLTPAGDLTQVWSGATVSSELAQAARRLLANGVDLARRDVDESARVAQDRRIVKAAVACASTLPLSLPVALEENASPSLPAILQAAVDAAVEAAGGIAPADVPSWLVALCAPFDPSQASTRLALGCAGLALELLDGRAERIVKLCEAARSADLVHFAATYPELRRDASLAAALARSARPSARACIALVLGELGLSAGTLVRAVIDAPDPKVRAARAASLFGELRAAGGVEAAGAVVTALAAQWPAREPAPREIVARAGLVAESATTFFAALGEGLGTRSAQAAIQCYEAALLAALKGLESTRGALRPALAPAAVQAAVGLCAGGQGAAVAVQLMGSGAELLTADAGALGAWADFTVAVARAVDAAGAGDAQPFYVTLVSIYARVPERLGDFGVATPLLLPIRARLQAAFGAAERRAETFERLQRERHLQDLAEEVARHDRGTAAQQLAARPEAGSPAVPPAEAGSGRTSLSVTLEVALGVDPSPPSRLGELLRVFSGFELVRRLLAFPARWLGYKTDGRLEIYRDALVVEETTRFLGQTLRTRRQEIAPSMVGRVERIERAPSTLLGLGLLALVVLTWFGASVAFDGFAIGDAVLIGGGLGAIAVGLLIDGALYTVFRRARGSTRLCLHLRDRRRPVRIAVARADAERVMSALRSLRIG